MRIATLNLRQGGRRSQHRLVDHLARHDPDVLVLTEFRESVGPKLRSLLVGMWPDHHWAPTRPNENGLLIASRQRVSPLPPAPDAPGPETRWREVELVGGPRIVGAYFPAVAKTLVPFWGRTIAHARRRTSDSWLVVGDFNSGLNGADASNTFRFSGHAGFGELLALGFVDAWRVVHGAERRDYSWYSHRNNGFRIDHLLLAPALKGTVRAAEYDHSTRASGVSDHSMLVVDLALPVPRS